MYQLAWVMYDGSYDQVRKLFKTEKELHDWAKGKGEYVWRKVTGLLTSMPLESGGGYN